MNQIQNFYKVTWIPKRKFNNHKYLQRMTEKNYDKHTIDVNYCLAHEGYWIHNSYKSMLLNIEPVRAFLSIL